MYSTDSLISLIDLHVKGSQSHKKKSEKAFSQRNGTISKLPFKKHKELWNKKELCPS